MTAETPHRVQLRRTKGWRMPPNTVSVARPTIWGNPFSVQDYGVDRAMGYYEQFLSELADMPLLPSAVLRDWRRGEKAFSTSDSSIYPSEAARMFLRGKNLACWCPLTDATGKPVPCHADVLLRIANEAAE